MHLKNSCLRFQTSVFLIVSLTTSVLETDAKNTANIEIQLLTRQILGDTSKFDRSKFINVHSTYTGSALSKENLEQLKQLNVGFGRAFDAPFAKHKNGTPYPSTEEIKARAEEIINTAEKDPLNSFRTTRRIITNEPNTAFNMEDDIKEMARYAVDVLQYHYTDETRPDFYSPLSIPFVAAGKYDKDQVKVRKRMADLIAEIGKEIDQRGLSTQVIGYTSAWPMMHYWDFKHWKERMQMFLDTAGPHIDGVCFLMMDATHMQKADKRRSGSRVEALLDLIETYGASKWGEPKPHAISEYGDVSHGWPLGDVYTPARASAELNSYNHFLFSLLGREDRLSIAVPFITTKSPWYYKSNTNNWQPFSADLWRPDPESIVDNKPTRFLETEKMEFYRLWKDVKGQRARIQCSDPDILSYAFTDKTEAYICINNFEEGQKEVTLSFLDTLPDIESMELKRMYVPKQEAVIYTKTQIHELPKRLTLQAHETVILRITYQKPLNTSSIVKTQNFYSKNFLIPIKAAEELLFPIQSPSTTTESNGTLRISFAREHHLSKSPDLKLNGQSIKFPDDWLGGDQAHRKGGFFGTIAVPMRKGLLQESNTVSLTFPDDGGRVSTVVLEVYNPEKNH